MRTRILRLWAILALALCVSAVATAKSKGVDPALLAKAEAGSAEAQHDLGDIYYFGNGVRRDYAQAAVWYLKAAEQGNADSEYRLGGFYHFGYGVPKDDAQAFLWTKKAAEQKNALAEHFLSVCYQDGWGVPKDDAHMIFWLRRAAEDGDAGSQYLLGWAYEFGDAGVLPQDFAQADFWLDLALSGEVTNEQRKDALKRRDEAASHLTPVELSQVKERVREWQKQHSEDGQ